MFKYFKYSFLVTIIGLALAYYWGQVHIGGVGIKMALIALFLSILEVTLSFDNAVVNALRLERMTKLWQQRFLTWGIIIAVFGMRLLFPLIIVSIFSKKSMADVFSMAMTDITQYSAYLHEAHVPLVTFGGIFLLLIFMSYFFDCEKETLWIKPIEKLFAFAGHLHAIEIITALFAILAVQSFLPEENRVPVIISGIGAILTFLIINGITETMEKFAEMKYNAAGTLKLGFIGFLYLELIDASFSFDGLLGAFAISKDIIIITIGLAIGAMFVRSLTLFMVDKKTLKSYIFLEHGAHWAIGFLAAVMLIGTKIDVPEWVTGVFSLSIISIAFISSIISNKNTDTTLPEINEKDCPQ